MSISKKQTQYVSIGVAIVVTALFIGNAIVHAHGTGASFEKQTEGGLVDIGYNVESFSENESTVFEYGLRAESGGDVLSFTDVWVRITDDSSTVFATGVHNARLGGALMTYKFPHAGEYELSVRFQNDGENIAEASFPLTVASGEGSEKDILVYVFIGFLLGAVIGIASLVVVRRSRQ